MVVKNNVSLKSFNTFGIDVKANALIEIVSYEDLDEFFNSKYAQGKYLFIGDGSNLLFVTDYNGTIVKMQTKGIEGKLLSDGTVLVKANAGENWDDFVCACLDNGWNGLENLAKIPGKVGSSPVQNIGAYGREVKDFIANVFVYEIATKKYMKLSANQCKFAYRDSIFKQEWKGKYVITAVEFLLSTSQKVNIQYEDVKQRVEHLENVVPKDIYNIVSEIRKEKLPDTTIMGNAGSFFKNPIVTKEKYEQLCQNYDFKSYPINEEFCKLSAAQLITKCGWKGKRCGEVGVHQNQALVLVNYGNATGYDVLNLAKKIQKDVWEQLNVQIEMEINVIQ